MNKKQIEKMIEIRQHFDRSYNIKENVIKISKHETFNHALAKFLVCYELLQNGNNFYTEVIFKNGGKRADIVSEGTVYEILHSETDERLNQKDYPFSIVSLRSRNIIKHYEQEILGD